MPRRGGVWPMHNSPPIIAARARASVIPTLASKGTMESRPSQFRRLTRDTGFKIIVPRRSDSAHLHRGGTRCRLDAAAMPQEMNIPGFHALRGFKPTRYSVHVNGPWCITFEFEDGDACRVDFEQYH
jgi:hypothetical protein